MRGFGAYTSVHEHAMPPRMATVLKIAGYSYSKPFPTRSSIERLKVRPAIGVISFLECYNM